MAVVTDSQHKLIMQSATSRNIWWSPMPFISVEPQSRAFAENCSNSLLAQFDKQLQIVTDRYLDFFQERSVNHYLCLVHFTHGTNRCIVRVHIEATWSVLVQNLNQLPLIFWSIDSLRKLVLKANIVDTLFDPRAKLSMTRVAWDKVRDSLEKGTHFTSKLQPGSHNHCRGQYPANFHWHFREWCH